MFEKKTTHPLGWQCMLSVYSYYFVLLTKRKRKSLDHIFLLILLNWFSYERFVQIPGEKNNFFDQDGQIETLKFGNDFTQILVRQNLFCSSILTNFMCFPYCGVACTLIFKLLWYSLFFLLAFYVNTSLQWLSYCVTTTHGSVYSHLMDI